MKQLHYLERAAPGEKIELYVNSNGGDLWGGFAVIDTMRQLSSPVHTVCVGRCRSMAAVIFAAGEPGHRGVAPRARVMLHQPRWTGEVVDGSAALRGNRVDAAATTRTVRGAGCSQ